MAEFIPFDYKYIRPSNRSSTYAVPEVVTIYVWEKQKSISGCGTDRLPSSRGYDSLKVEPPSSGK